MLQQSLIPLSDSNGWEHQLRNIWHSPAHTWGYNQAIQFSTKLPTYLYCASAPNFKAVCPIAVREKDNNFDLVTPYGFGGFASIGSYKNFNSLWRKFLKEQGYICGYIGLHPLLNEIPIFSPDIVSRNKNIYVLDLHDSSDIFLKKIAKTHRYEIKQWQNSNVNIIINPPSSIETFYNLYQETLQRVKASYTYHFQFETLASFLRNQNSLVIAAAVNNKIEAMSIFLHTPYISEYFLNASSLNGQRHTRGILFTAVQLLRDFNIPYLNLGGGISENDNLENFKRRFGGKCYSYHALKEIYDKTRFERLCENLTVARKYFPPYHTS